MKNVLAVAAIAGALLGSGAQAETYMWPAPPAPSVTPAVRYFLPAGTPLMLRTRTQVSTKMNEPGDRVYLEVAEPVAFRGQTVIPVGAPVIGEVAQVQRNGHFGVKGKIAVHLIQVETPSGPVRLSGTTYDEGRSGTLLSVGTIAFVSVLGFLVHGTSGDIPADTNVKAQLAEPMNFRWQPGVAEQAVAMTEAVPDSAPPVASLGNAQALTDPTG
jgi:hypothetical protein